MHTRTLDRSSGVSLHRQLRDILQQMILEGSYASGETFPTERELEAIFHVSRTTVREAISELVRLGYITRQQGKGTFVARSQEAFDATHLSSFTEDMTRRGKRAGAVVLGLEQEEPNADTIRHFGPTIEKVWCIRRLRLADHEAIALQTSFLPIKRFDFSFEQLADASLYRLLEDRYGLFAVSADEVITAAIATNEQARLLAIEPGAPLLCVDRFTYAQTGEPIEYVNIVYRADRYKFFVNQHRGD